MITESSIESEQDGAPGRLAGARKLALSVEDAAAALGVSRDSFERHVMADLRLVRVGRRLLVPTAELERWVEHEMAIPLLAELSGVNRSREAPRRR